MLIVRYSGTINFENCGFSTVSKRFDLVGDGHILINWHSPTAENGFYQFLGVAQKTSEHRYITPWVYLTDKNGAQMNDKSMAAIEFTTTNITENEISLEGKWIDVNLTEFPFLARLNRVWRNAEINGDSPRRAQ